jgi:hypothetical protein
MPLDPPVLLVSLMAVLQLTRTGLVDWVQLGKVSYRYSVVSDVMLMDQQDKVEAK